MAGELRRAGARVGVDERTESVGRKIRDAELSKVPYMLVLGDREQESGKLAGALTRRRRPGGDDLGELAERINEGADGGLAEPRTCVYTGRNAGHPHHDAPLSAPVPAFPIHFPLIRLTRYKMPS